MALRDIVTRHQPSAYIKWGYSRVLYLTYTMGILKLPPVSNYHYYNYKLQLVHPIYLLYFRGEIAPLSSSYNILGLVPGLLLTFSMLLTETSEIQKVYSIWTCPGINVLAEQ